MRPERVDPGPGHESVWDYPRPPRVEPDTRLIRVEFAGVAIAETTRALRVLETASPPTFYLPAADVRGDLLVPAQRSSYCEWKGPASYWTIRVGDREARNAAWGYLAPKPGFAALKDHFAFYAGRVDACRVGGERVTPQPGRFYGGWITSEVVGPFKGEPGSEGW